MAAWFVGASAGLVIGGISLFRGVGVRGVGVWAFSSFWLSSIEVI